MQYFNFFSVTNLNAFSLLRPNKISPKVICPLESPLKFLEELKTLFKYKISKPLEFIKFIMSDASF